MILSGTQVKHNQRARRKNSLILENQSHAQVGTISKSTNRPQLSDITEAPECNGS